MWDGAGEEKQIQLLRMLNKLLDKHPKSRQRCLAYSTPTVVPLMHYVGPPPLPAAPFPV